MEQIISWLSIIFTYTNNNKFCPSYVHVQKRERESFDCTKKKKCSWEYALRILHRNKLGRIRAFFCPQYTMIAAHDWIKHLLLLISEVTNRRKMQLLIGGQLEALEYVYVKTHYAVKRKVFGLIVKNRSTAQS